VTIPPRRRLPPTPRVRAALLAASAVVSEALIALVWSQLPRQLSVHTDIIGYPEAADFNIERYFWAYGLVAGLFPFLTLALYLLLRRTLAPGPAQPLGVIALLDRRAPAASGDRVNLAVSAGGNLLVGITLGFEIAIGGGWQDLGGVVLAVAATAYGVAVATIAAVAVAGPLRHRELEAVLAGVNAVLATLTVLGLAWVSAGTKVTVSSDGTVHHYPWFPWWLGALVTIALLAAVIRAIRTSAVARTIEHRVLVLVVAPVLLFLFVAVLPGAPGDMDTFHEGEQLGAAHLTAAGRFPWRDLLFIHGPLGDVLQPLLNMHVFGDTRWGNLAGEAVLSKPASVVALFLLCAYLFRDNWLFLVGTQVAIVTGWVFALQVQSSRLLFVPIVIILLATLLRRPTWPRAIAFTTLLLVQTVLTPEGSYMVPAYLGAVVLYELVHRQGFTRTIRCGIMTTVLGAGWVVFLASQHALDDFVFYYRTFAPGHELTGGLTVALGEGQSPTAFGGHLYYVFAAGAPVVLVLLAIWYFAARAPAARTIPVDDWVIGATAVFVGLYYVKFISRTDHVYQPFEIAIPVLFYAIYRVVSAAEAWLASRRLSGLPPRHTVTLPLLVVLLIGAPTSLLTLTRGVPSHLATFAPSEPPVARVGYVLNREPLFRSIFPAPAKSVGPSLVHDLSAIMRAYVPPGERIFDFSNNPGLFWYVLRLDPATRYYHVSMAIRQATQHDLIRELRKEQPKIAVFSSDWLGLPLWDGIANEVRHYDVSRYLLDHYHPLLHSHGFLVFARNGARTPPVSDVTSKLEEPAQTSDLYFRTFPCDWGYTPDFLTIHPQSESGAVTLQPEHGALQVPAELAAHFGWLEVEGTSTFKRTSFELSDRPGVNADARRTIRFRTRGGTDTVRVQVGSCSQWHGYLSRTLYLRTDPPQPIRAVRLLR
jgi:hypothetical protein